jgi:hypothetical protein
MDAAHQPWARLLARRHGVTERHDGTNEGITMNTQLLEAPPSPVPSAQHVATHPSAAGLTVSRSSAADRLALRVGVALVIWGRRTVGRADARSRAAARADHELSRIGRERAAGRSLLLSVPRR